MTRYKVVNYKMRQIVCNKLIHKTYECTCEDIVAKLRTFIITLVDSTTFLEMFVQLNEQRSCNVQIIYFEKQLKEVDFILKNKT